MTEIGNVKKAYCAKCGGDRNCDVTGYHLEKGGDLDGYYEWRTEWFLLVCRGCEHVFAQSESTDSETVEYYYDETGETQSHHPAQVRTWPPRAKRDRPEWFDAGGVQSHVEGVTRLDDALFELYSALDNDLLILASIGLRTTFDVAGELLGVAAELPFSRKVRSLVELGHIKEGEAQHIDLLINAGNASAHRGWKPSLEDVDSLMAILESFIYECFVVPERKKREAARIKKVQGKVPLKQPRKQKRKPAGSGEHSRSPSSSDPTPA